MPFNFLCPQGHWLTGDESQMGQQLQCPICGSLFMVPVVQPAVPMGFQPGTLPQQVPPGMPLWQPAGPTTLPGAGVPGAWPGPPGPGVAPGFSGMQPAWPAGQAASFPFPPGTAPVGEPQVEQAPLIRTGSEPQLPGPWPSAPVVEPAGQAADPAAQAAAAMAQASAGEPRAVGERTAPAPAGEAAAPPQTGDAQPSTSASRQPRILHIPCPRGHELQTPEEMLDQEALCPYCRTQFRLQYKNSVEYRREKERAEEERQARVNRLAIKLSIWGTVLVLLFVIVLVVLHFAK